MLNKERKVKVYFRVLYLGLVCRISLLFLLALWVCLTAPWEKERRGKGTREKERNVTLAKPCYLVTCMKMWGV